MINREGARKARKVGGSYQAEGHVVCTFKTLGGLERHVFEFDQPAGMLHIFNPQQIEFYDEIKECDEQAPASEQ